ncbi:hypothetical protein KIN20_006423 [Parelaphostrongylus tenuis]|nr:hypothetical protein KIN20_006423 [Parelaphostrongylus tenuis]
MLGVVRLEISPTTSQYSPAINIERITELPSLPILEITRKRARPVFYDVREVCKILMQARRQSKARRSGTSTTKRRKNL